MKFSFQLYSARNFMPWKDVYRSLSSLGFTDVEGFGAVYEDAQATRDLLDAHSLAMPSGHFSVDDLENNLKASLQIASTLDCSRIFCPYLDESERPSDAAGWQQFGQRLNDIGARVKDAGKNFGWHNHDFEFRKCDDGSFPMRLILESAPDIDWEIDVAWVARAGEDPQPWIKEFGARVTAVHVKDIAATGECLDEDGWADVGFGTMDWKGLMQQLKQDTKADLFIAEHDNPSDNQRFAERSLQSLKGYV